MAPTPSKSNHSLQSRTPNSKHRLNFNVAKPSPNPNSAVKEAPPAEHPVEVVGRIRDYPDRKEKSASALQINPDRHSLRVKTEIGYRDFTLDGVSLSEEEDLDSFYKKFVGSRISGVKLGDKCTVMMYGPTGSGKSHTMFGCPKYPGIVYRSLKEILGEKDGDGDEGFGIGTFVQVSVLEIYNEEIYDLLSTNSGGGLGFGWPKGSASKVRLEVMGKKAKNATFISGTEAAKISKEIQKVEKRRIVRSTLCNERSSRSHCMIILDVPTVGGRLMLVDMAGSENIEQAGQNSLEAKMQTGKINQGNIALKRVVESIANGDSHVPFRDSKLTMLLQDSFEDDKSKILMILCASPDPKEMHKTIATLEYGAKAKCIVRGPHTPIKSGSEDPSSALMGSRIAAMDQFIFKLQMENKQREKERNEAHKALMKKEEEVSALRQKLSQAEGKESGQSEEEINLKVNERVQMLKSDLEKKVRECERMAHEFVELERRKMEETIKQQQQEVEMLRRRLEEIELELVRSRGSDNKRPSEVDGSSFAKKLLEAYADEDPGMVKSMDLDRSMDFDSVRHETSYSDNSSLPLWNPASLNLQAADNNEAFVPLGTENLRLSTVFEEAEEEQEKSEDEEVQKEVIEEKTVYSIATNPPYTLSSEPFALSPLKLSEHDYHKDESVENDKDLDSNRRKRIQTIFTLCGNYRELSQHGGTPNPLKVFETPGIEDSTAKRSLNKENYDISEAKTVGGGGGGDLVDVHVKWEASKDQPGKAITSFKVEKGATLADLRKLIEKQVGSDKQGFNFLTLGDSNEAPISREKEAAVQASNLPLCSQLKGHLASLRPVKGGGFQGSNHHHLPLSPLQNILNVTAAR